MTVDFIGYDVTAFGQPKGLTHARVTVARGACTGLQIRRLFSEAPIRRRLSGFGR